MSNEYDCVCVDEANQIWEAMSHGGQGFVHIVRLPSSSGNNFASCNCRDFTARLIPCRAICAVYSRIQDPLFSKTVLHPRWWISNHPEFPICKAELGFPSEFSTGTDDQSDQHGPDLALQMLQQIRVPNTQQARFRRLDEQCKELISVGSSADDFTYRFVMNGVASLINAAKSLRDGEAVQ